MIARLARRLGGAMWLAHLVVFAVAGLLIGVTASLGAPWHLWQTWVLVGSSVHHAGLAVAERHTGRMWRALYRDEQARRIQAERRARAWWN